jgi:hypothetical protein
VVRDASVYRMAWLGTEKLASIPSPVVADGGGSDEVGEDDQGEDTFGFGEWAMAGNERFELDEHGLGTLELEYVIGAFELDVAGARDVLGHVSAVPGRDGGVVSIVHHHGGCHDA